MTTLAIKLSGGGVAIMRVLNGADAEGTVAKWAAAHPDEYISHQEIDPKDIPADHSQRAGWSLGQDGKIAIDPAKVPAPPLDVKKRLQALEAAVIAKTPVTKAEIDAKVELVAVAEEAAAVKVG